MNAFGLNTLKWKTEKPTETVNFLDLTITLNKNGTLTTKTYQKEDNLYLYRTPNSCQPPSILKSFVYGQLHRYFWQNTYEEDFLNMVSLFIKHMYDRGHLKQDFIPILKASLDKVILSKLPNPKNTMTKPKTNNNNLFLHLPYHPNNPNNNDLKELTKTLKKDFNTNGLDIERIIIAYSRAPNIGDLCKKHRLEGFINTGIP